MQVLTGSAYDVIVDVRRESQTYLQWHAVTLRAGEHTQVYVPAGCLHGFLALEDQTLLFVQAERRVRSRPRVRGRLDRP